MPVASDSMAGVIGLLLRDSSRVPGLSAPFFFYPGPLMIRVLSRCKSISRVCALVRALRYEYRPVERVSRPTSLTKRVFHVWELHFELLSNSYGNDALCTINTFFHAGHGWETRDWWTSSLSFCLFFPFSGSSISQVEYCSRYFILAKWLTVKRSDKFFL